MALTAMMATACLVLVATFPAFVVPTPESSHFGLDLGKGALHEGKINVRNGFTHWLGLTRVENKHRVCFRNDWKARDKRAHAYRTFNNCRWSAPNCSPNEECPWGRATYYCTDKPKACRDNGYALD